MLSALLFTLTTIAGQAPAAAPAPATPPAITPAPSAVQPAADGSSYNREARRDPFVSLVGGGADPAGTTRLAGLRGLMVSEATVKGIMRGGSGFLAMIQAADNKTYIVRSGERLLDGSVKTITQDTVTFTQELNDPLTLVKQRDVAKRIRGAEGGS